DGAPSLPGEYQIDRVFGEYGDERKHRDREAGGDVELRHLGGPGQHEGGAHDGEPEQQGGERVGHLDVSEPDHESGNRDQEGEEDRGEGADRVDVAEVGGGGGGG